MSGFFGRDTLLADLELHKYQAGLLTTATLNKQGGGTVSLANVCLWPGDSVSALGHGGFPASSGQLTVWRTGEADSPRPDDTVTVQARSGPITVLVVSVAKTLNDDEADGYAKYDCRVTKAIGG